MKILFLSAWYPNRYDAMEGLFVRKHAEAVSRHVSVAVLYIKEDPEISDFEIVEEKYSGVQEYYVYYPSRKNKIGYKILKTINWLRAYRKGYKYVLSKQWKPDIIHVNVLTRTGVIAYLLKKYSKIPYVITEHWTRYLREHFSYFGFLRKKMTELVIRNASMVMPVSNILCQAMFRCGLKKNNYQVVNNVVDDFFFKQQLSEKHSKKRLLHVSCFSESHKNVKGILRSILSLKQKRTDFELIIVGYGPDFDNVRAYAEELDLLDVVLFVGEKRPQDVAELFYNSDIFILFSNYETSGVVVMESLACGKPVIATPVGIVPEDIHERNGLIVPCQDEKLLTEKIDWLLDNYEEYDADAIKKEAYEKYSYEAIGKKIFDIYKSVIEERR